MISRAFYDSPLGQIEIQATRFGLRTLQFVEAKSDTAGSTPAPEGAVHENALLRECKRQLDEYFHGERRRFSLKLDLKDQTTFHREVYRLVQAIPYGKTRTYSDIARTMGNPGAVRAVGQANSHNPLPVIIPCHRVLDKEGGLRGYIYGLNVKQALLELENPVKFHHQAELFEAS